MWAYHIVNPLHIVFPVNVKSHSSIIVCGFGLVRHIWVQRALWKAKFCMLQASYFVQSTMIVVWFIAKKGAGTVTSPFNESDLILPQWFLTRKFWLILSHSGKPKTTHIEFAAVTTCFAMPISAMFCHGINCIFKGHSFESQKRNVVKNVFSNKENWKLWFSIQVDCVRWIT